MKDAQPPPLRLIRSEKGIPYPNHANIVTILQHDPLYATTRIWYDEFLDRVFLANSPARPWRDEDDTKLTVEMQERFGVIRASRGTVAEAVRLVARQRTQHVVRDWVNPIIWDQEPRIEMAFCDYWGASQDAYTLAASKNFFISLIARIMNPGCKVDTMPVFEGPQGLRKSSALAVLGGQWFGTSHHAAGGVEFLKVLRGKWLIEIAELQSFTKADVTAAKNMLSTPVDTYRPSYGQHVVDFPRQCVFAGTTNADDWGADDTGLRRFWPIRCGEIDLLNLGRMRDQLFAEALVCYRAGATWWEMPKTTAEVQAARQHHDAWSGIVLTWCASQRGVDVALEAKDILVGALQMRPDLIDKRAVMRVTSILRLAGWERKRERRGGDLPWIWRKPDDVVKV